MPALRRKLDTSNDQHDNTVQASIPQNHCDRRDNLLHNEHYGPVDNQLYTKPWSQEISCFWRRNAQYDVCVSTPSWRSDAPRGTKHVAHTLGSSIPTLSARVIVAAAPDFASNTARTSHVCQLQCRETRNCTSRMPSPS